MIDFKPITLSDKPVFDQFFQQNTYRSSEWCFTNLYGWAHTFDTRYAVKDGFLLVKFMNLQGGCSFLKPFGTGDLKKIIEELIADCGCRSNIELGAVTPDMREEIEALMPGVFVATPIRDSFDYVYASEKLRCLKGKKLQSKRNHINRFKKENEWQYVSLNEHPEMIGACKEMLRQWYGNHVKASEPSLIKDYTTTTRFLKNFKELGLRGGAILVDNRVIAFSLGIRLSDDTFIVHVEKAFADIHGAYAIINQQFVEHEAAQFTYINREEDMGLESLRKAKLSYRPDILLEKNRLKIP
ncbi:DUF2156 domain-containing protein [Limibacterium fermenti]|uniref:DUF2156 domain-containing protein n=1 Tax=Limibacterium fermenti TaxID=3229863 RepID=UPI000E90DBF0|nr:hypothetical protein [Porphyromonadaceae bacterium]HBX45284.1 hypothetical protein [Porphyromonadaceae bacterium]